jgi:hypothetical protein
MKNSSTALIALLIPKIGYQATKNMLKNVNLFYFSSKEEGEEIKGGEFKQRCYPYNKFLCNR